MPSAVLDIGAHHGETVAKLLQIFPNTVIHAVEPTPDSVEILNRRFRGNPNVKVHKLALADRIGQSRFFVNQNSQTNSLLDNGEENKAVLSDHTAHINEIEVETLTLDHFCSSLPNFSNCVIKADVQGAEVQLINGGTQTLKEHTDVFYSEVSLAKMYEGEGDLFIVNSLLTTKCELELFQIYRTRSNSAGRALWTDAMWISKRLRSFN